MPNVPDCDELILRIESSAPDRYRVLAEGPGRATAKATFEPPFSPVELENFVLTVNPGRGRVRGYRSPQMREAQRFGAELASALLTGDVRDVWLSARRAAEEHGRGLRITLALGGVPELMAVPWEFLYQTPAFLAQSIYSPVVRTLDIADVRDPLPVELPLRILGVISSPYEFAQLDVAGEREKLENALAGAIQRGVVDIDWVEGATLAAIDRAIGAADDTHVLHYIGHGSYDERNEEGVLMLEDANGRAQPVTGGDLCALLQDERSLRLIVLNACEGARSSRVDPFSGVAAGLLQCRIPAVIGMQFEITDDAAKTFGGRLYEYLADGYPVDAALAQARKTMFAGHDIEFGTPVLFLRGTEARLFDVTEVRPAPPAATAPAGELTARLERLDPAGEEVGERWELTIENVGSSRLRDVTAIDAQGDVLGSVSALEPGQQQVMRWRGAGSAKALVTVRAIDEREAVISEQVSGESLAAEGLATLLILGTNVFGDEMFTYLRFPTDRLDEVKAALASGEDFAPNNYGTVIAAGRGKPSEQVIAEVGEPDFKVFFERPEGAAEAPAAEAPAAEPAAWAREILRVAEEDAAPGSPGWISEVALSPDGRVVATLGLAARMWQLPDGVELATLTDEDVMEHIALDGGGRSLAASAAHVAWVRDVATGNTLLLVEHGADVTSLALSRDSTLLVTGSEDRTAQVRRVAGGDAVAKVSHRGAVNAVALSADKRFLATGGDDDSVRVWLLPSGEELLRLEHWSSVSKLAVSADGFVLASAGVLSREVRVWALPTGDEIVQLAHENTVSAIALSGNGGLLATGTDHGDIHVWALPEGRVIARLRHEGWISSIGLSDDGSRLASATHLRSDDKSAHVWEASGGWGFAATG
jgi:hypothetical protein